RGENQEYVNTEANGAGKKNSRQKNELGWSGVNAGSCGIEQKCETQQCRVEDDNPAVHLRAGERGWKQRTDNLRVQRETERIERRRHKRRTQEGKQIRRGCCGISAGARA